MTFIQRILKQRGTKDYILRKAVSSGLVDSNYPSKGSVEITEDYYVYSVPMSISLLQKSGTLVKQGDVLLYVDPTYVINTNDRFVKNDEVYNIVSCQEHSLSGEILYYTVHLRK